MFTSIHRLHKSLRFSVATHHFASPGRRSFFFFFGNGRALNFSPSFRSEIGFWNLNSARGHDNYQLPAIIFPTILHLFRSAAARASPPVQSMICACINVCSASLQHNCDWFFSSSLHMIVVSLPFLLLLGVMFTFLLLQSSTIHQISHFLGFPFSARISCASFPRFDSASKISSLLLLGFVHTLCISTP